uniref:ERCC4 domain-containing protein n=1 Tax=viral metagenome TaxID=1070528 RepID=A0A6C0JX12_9ZZZZ
MHIVIDERERDLYEKIDSIVNFSGNNTSIQISREVLPLGDILIRTDGQRNVVLIERKSFSDLLASIKDGRYEEQSYRLIHTGEYSPHNIIYMIEGMFSQVRTPMEKRIILSAMTSLNHFKGFSVCRTCSLNETAETIVWMAEKMEKEFQRGKRAAYTLAESPCSPNTSITNDLGELVQENSENTQISSANYCTVVKKVKKDNVTPENIGEIVLCQIPGISSVTAIAIMKQYGTFSNLIDEIRNNPASLENIVCENSGKARKISKACVKNVIEYLGK